MSELRESQVGASESTMCSRVVCKSVSEIGKTRDRLGEAAVVAAAGKGPYWPGGDVWSWESGEWRCNIGNKEEGIVQMRGVWSDPYWREGAAHVVLLSIASVWAKSVVETRISSIMEGRHEEEWGKWVRWRVVVALIGVNPHCTTMS